MCTRVDHQFFALFILISFLISMGWYTRFVFFTSFSLYCLTIKKERKKGFIFVCLNFAIFKSCLLTSNTKSFSYFILLSRSRHYGFFIVESLLANQQCKKIPNPYNYVSRIRLNKFGAAIYFCAILHYFTWPHFRGV